MSQESGVPFRSQSASHSSGTPFRSQSRDDGSLWVRLVGEGFDLQVRAGRLWIKAQSSMLGYLNAPSPFDEDGWYNTHDVVEVDGPYVRILGRTTELINVGGQKVYPSEVESALLELHNVSDGDFDARSGTLTLDLESLRDFVNAA